LKLKSNVFVEFQKFKVLIEKELGCHITTLMSTNGGEFYSKEFLWQVSVHMLYVNTQNARSFFVNICLRNVIGCKNYVCECLIYAFKYWTMKWSFYACINDCIFLLFALRIAILQIPKLLEFRSVLSNKWI
jgi:hypothetical protein